MNIDAVLRRLGDLERSLATLYEWHASIFAADAEAAFVFFKMSAEEKSHASLVEYQRRLIRNTPQLSVDVEVDMSETEAATAKAKELRAAATPPALDEAVRDAIRIETSAAETHTRNALKRTTPELARLLDALGGEDRLHVERVVSLARRRGIGTVSPPAPGR